MEQLGEALAYTALVVSAAVAVYQRSIRKREELIEQQLREVSAVMELLVSDARPILDTDVGWVIELDSAAYLLLMHRHPAGLFRMPSASMTISRHYAPSYHQSLIWDLRFGVGEDPAAHLMKMLERL